MRLIEHDGKSLLAQHGLHSAQHRLLEASDTVDFTSCSVPSVLKAQTLDGKRGKAGLIERVDGSNVASKAEQLRSRLAQLGLEPLLMLEPAVDIEQELYAAVRLDGSGRYPCILFSASGGMDVETHVDRVATFPIDPIRGVYPHDLLPLLRASQLSPAQWGNVARFLARMYDVFVAEDALLIEINPLAITQDGLVVALDAKIELDDSAAFRHPQRAKLRSSAIRESTTTDLEARAAADGIDLVELSGSVALLTSGAGLGMAVVDQLTDAGMHPANFVDAPGGAGLERKVEYVFELARHDRVKAVAVFILQTAQPLARATGALIRVLERHPLSKPLVVGLVAAAAGERGMTAEQAREQLAGYGAVVVFDLEELVQELRSRVPSR